MASLEDLNPEFTDFNILETLEDGSIEISLEEDGEELVEEYMVQDEVLKDHFRNLVEELDPDFVADIGLKVVEDTDADEQSRSEWLKTIEMGLDLLGIKLEEGNQPFEGACSAQHPLLLESMVKFQSKASNELLPADGPVKTKILGQIDPERENQALRVKRHMNYQITEEMPEFYTDTERMLFALSGIGSAFKKTYYDSVLERPVSEYVPASQFVIADTATDLYRAPGYTHKLFKSKDALNEAFATGFYLKPDDLGEAKFRDTTSVEDKINRLQGMSVSLSETEEGYELYERYCNLFIEEFEDREEMRKHKVGSPYIVTVEARTGVVLGIRRNWNTNDTKRKKRKTFVHYTFVPGFGFYGLGFIHLLGNLQLTLTSSMRSLIDSGQFANLQGGFKLKGVRMVGDNTPIRPGEFKEIEAGMLDISKGIMPLPFKEPSQTLLAMLQFVDAKGQKFADSTEQIIADSTNYGPVGTTLALLDASTKFFSAIHKRLHLAQKEELGLIARINSETLPSEYTYNIENETVSIYRSDYDDRVDVVPVSDPNISSNAHRMAKAQTMLQIALQTPEQHNMREVLKHIYNNMDYANVDRILVEEEQPEPTDPIHDIHRAIEGKPIKAFPDQDHESHIAIKQGFLEDPTTGGSPLMQKAAIALQLNIQEHMVLQYATQVAMMQEGGDPVTVAAQKTAQLNRQKMEQQIQQVQEGQQALGQAEMMIAQADLQRSQTGARKQQFDELYRSANLALDAKKLEHQVLMDIERLLQVDRKFAEELKKMVTEKGIDAIMKSLVETAQRSPTPALEGEVATKSIISV